MIPFDQKVKIIERKHYAGSFDQSEPEACSNSLIIGEKGKVHFSTADPQSQKDFRRGKQYVPHKLHSGDIENQKRKNFPSMYGVFGKEDMIGHNQNRHFSDAQSRRSLEFVMPASDWARKKVVSSAVLNSPSEYEVEETMTRKHRLQTNEEIRNFIPSAALGDKPYREADREPGFYAKGGLVTGSTIGVHKSGKPMGKSTLVMRESSAMTGPSFDEKIKQLQMDYELSQIQALTVR